MVSNTNDVDRRNALKTLGGSVAAFWAMGPTSATPDDSVRVNVGYRSKGGRQAALDAADRVIHDFSFDAVTIVTSRAAAERLEARPDVTYVEIDGTWRALSQTLPWGIDRVDADVAHDDGETGDGADVAIIDTGIDDDHPDLQANLADPSDPDNHEAWVNCRGRNCNYDWSDDHDHGTHCAGIADAVDNDEGVVGVSTEATLHSLKVLDKNGRGSWSDIAAAIDYTAQEGWDVASMSLGGSSGSSLVEQAVEDADDEGVLLVAAAGNDGPCTDCVGYPAKYPEVVAVSATNCSDDLASFSSQGPEIELAAPGEDVYSTVIDGYDTFSGTSMACPHVSGAGAQLMANGYSNDQARQQLKDTAEDIGLSDNEQGAGLLDVAAALGLDSSDDGFGDGPNC